jgi:PAS domain S-box-containing protein
MGLADLRRRRRRRYAFACPPIGCVSSGRVKMVASRASLPKPSPGGIASSRATTRSSPIDGLLANRSEALSATAIREALTAAMDHSSAPMVLSDPHLPDTPMVAVNQAFAALTGYPVEEIVGRNCRFLQGPRTDPVSAPRIRACLDAGQGCIEWIVNYRRDGSHFYNLLFISPVRDEAGELLFFFGNQLDITRGSPAWLSEVPFGSAHLVPALEDGLLKPERLL